MSEVFTFPITKGNFDSKEAAQAAMELKKKELERAHSKGSSGNEEVSEEKGEWSYYFEFVTPQ